MKKIAIVAILLAVSVSAVRAQESRQDISLSGTALIEPFIGASTDVLVHSTTAYGALLSYRFMVTPSSAIEANYGITYQNKINYSGSGIGNTKPGGPIGIDILTRNQEITFAYVRSFNFRKLNPFVEGGGGALLFMPITNSGTKTQGTKQQTAIAGLYGAGIAYEISPSFDIRAEYRGLITKVPIFGDPRYKFDTNKWWNVNVPAVGVAYHF